MERFRQDLEERLGDWVRPLPQCAEHAGVAAAAVCPRCRRPICSDCIYPLPTSLRCHRCRPWLDRVVPTAWIAPLSLIAGVLGRRWALQTLAFCLGLGVILWCFPGLVRSQPPTLPEWLAGSRLHAPFLEQSFRLSTVGRALADRGNTDRAQIYFERAESACRRHLADAGDSPLNPQVWLGIGRLQEQQGHTAEAKTTLLQLKNDAPDRAPVAGVASYYLGRIAENEQDLSEALDYYNEALKGAHQDKDALAKLVDFYANDHEKNQWIYVVASLTHTVTSASAIQDDIEKAIARCSTPEKKTPAKSRAPGSVEFLGTE